MVKTLKKFLTIKTLMIFNLGVSYRGLKFYKVCINDDTGLTFIYYMARSNLVAYAAFKRGETVAKSFNGEKTCSK